MDCAEVREARLDALYGEAGEEELRRVAEHHAECAACRAEFDALRGVRRKLAAWKVKPAEQPLRARRIPTLVTLAAAASLLLAAGAALRISGARFELRQGPLSVSAGGSTEAALLRDLHDRQREEIRQVRAELAAVRAQPAPALDQQAILQRVQQELQESERRQAQRIDARLDDLLAHSEAQRRYDMARISAGLSYLDGKSGEHVARTSELMAYVLQAAQEK